MNLISPEEMDEYMDRALDAELNPLAARLFADMRSLLPQTPAPEPERKS